jgi:hypothetical protein
MPLPKPRPGLVFRYEYVWKKQSLAGRSVGEKARPVCCVAVAVSAVGGDPRVLIAPITTQPPVPTVPAIELSVAIRRHLGLDADTRSWVILNEANIDRWPTPDMRQVPGKPGRFEYGVLPLKMVTAIREMIQPALLAKRFDVVAREDDEDETMPPGWTLG